MVSFKGSAGRACAYATIVSIAVVHVFIALNAVSKQSLTFDETAHISAGLSYWRYNDYRLNPENGVLPQLLAGSFLHFFGNFSFALPSEPNYQYSDCWSTGFDLLYAKGNDRDLVLWMGRLPMAINAGLLVLLVGWMAREIYSDDWLPCLMASAFAGLSPTLIGHGPLMTSDAVMTVWWALSSHTLWKVVKLPVVQRTGCNSTVSINWFCTIKDVLTAGICLGMAVGAKHSGVLMLPVGILLVLLRARFLVLNQKPILRWLAQVFAAALCMASIGLVVLWGLYGFHYSAFVQDGAQQWKAAFRDTKGEAMLNGPLWEVIRFLQSHQLLPESFLYGFSYAVRSAVSRSAFLMGDFAVNGWKHFFLVCVAVKTPLIVLGLSMLSIIVWGVNWGYNVALASLRGEIVGDDVSDSDTTRNSESNIDLDSLVDEDSNDNFQNYNKQKRAERLEKLATNSVFCSGNGSHEGLLVAFIVYWVVAINTNLNIGQRHMLPTYPMMWIMAAYVFKFLSQRSKAEGHSMTTSSPPVWCAVVTIAVLVKEVLPAFDHPLAYFNSLAGGPENGYKYLVDSSLDWGQDLPGLEDFVSKLHQNATLEGSKPPTVMLAYFGWGHPSSYGLGDATGVVHTCPSVSGTGQPHHYKAGTLVLPPGIWFISASLFQPVYNTHAMGRWNPWFEMQFRRFHKHFMRAAANEAAFQSITQVKETLEMTKQYDCFRLGRIAAGLRNTKPDFSIGHSLLGFNLTKERYDSLLNGPLPSETASGDMGYLDVNFELP